MTSIANPPRTNTTQPSSNLTGPTGAAPATQTVAAAPTAAATPAAPGRWALGAGRRPAVTETSPVAMPETESLGSLRALAALPNANGAVFARWSEANFGPDSTWDKATTDRFVGEVFQVLSEGAPKNPSFTLAASLTASIKGSGRTPEQLGQLGDIIERSFNQTSQPDEFANWVKSSYGKDVGELTQEEAGVLAMLGSSAIAMTGAQLKREMGNLDDPKSAGAKGLTTTLIAIAARAELPDH